MKFRVSFLVLLFGVIAGPVCAIEYGSVMDDKIRAAVSAMSNSEPSPSGSVPAAAEAPQGNTAVTDALGVLGKPAAPKPAVSTDVSTDPSNPFSSSGVLPEAAAPSAEQQPPAALEEPAGADVRLAIQKYVADASQSAGTFNFQDPAASRMRKLILIRINDPMEKGARGYTMNADFSDIETGDLVNLKFELFVLNGQVNVIGIQMNTVNGQQPQPVLNDQFPQPQTP